MAIEFRCSQCNQLLRVSDASAGKNARCPKCQALMTVPAASAVAPAAAPPPMPAAALPPFPGVGSSFGKAAPVPEPPPPPAFAPAAPPASDDPFFFLKQESAPPPPKPAANPFGEGKSAVPFVAPASGAANPYASPAYATPPTKNAAGQRLGLPWETKKKTLSCWFETMGLIIGSPTRAFGMMRQRGGLGTPIMYNLYGVGIPLGVLAIILVPIGMVVTILIATQDGAAAAVFAGVMVAYAAALLVMVVLSVTVGALIMAAILHVLLMICGGAKRDYETTFRVLSYANGALSPLHMVAGFLPVIGPLGLMIWQIVLLIIGLTQAHETTTGKAALAVLLPIGLCMALYVGLMFLFVLAPLFAR